MTSCSRAGVNSRHRLGRTCFLIPKPLAASPSQTGRDAATGMAPRRHTAKAGAGVSTAVAPSRCTGPSGTARARIARASRGQWTLTRICTTARSGTAYGAPRSVLWG